MVPHFVFHRIGSAHLSTTKHKHAHNLSHFTDYTGKDVIFYSPVSSAFPHTRIYFDCIDKCVCVCGNCFRNKSTQNMKNWFWLCWNWNNGCRRVAFNFLKVVLFCLINPNREKLIEKKKDESVCWIFSENFPLRIWFSKVFCLVFLVLLSKYFQNKIHRGKCSFWNIRLLLLHWEFMIAVKFAFNINIIQNHYDLLVNNRLKEAVNVKLFNGMFIINRGFGDIERFQ